jgi:hypothetical protein
MGSWWMFQVKYRNTKYPGMYEAAVTVDDRFSNGCTLAPVTCWVERLDQSYPAHLISYKERPRLEGGWIAKPPANDVALNVRVFKTRTGAVIDYVMRKFSLDAAEIRKSMKEPHQWVRRDPRCKPMVAEQEALAIRQILIEECGYRLFDHDYFVPSVEQQRQGEYRFQGYLGFGGKFYWGHDSYFVSNYSEDEDGATKLMAAKANQRLEALWHEHTPVKS